MIESKRRYELWNQLKQFPLGEVNASDINNKNIYRGQAGIYCDKKYTSSLTNNGSGVAVSILHTGRHYSDELTADGMLYNYPNTNRPKSHDINEIIAAKNTMQLSLPIFVILPGLNNKLREVKLGWVIDFDDEAEVFLINFSDEKLKNDLSETKNKPFKLKQTITDSDSNTTPTKIRPNQHQFRFNVHKNYGCKCAVCDIQEKNILDAAHICGKEDNGSDDWRNGILLCKNHHKSFDKGLFKIEPKNLEIILSKKIKSKDLKITEDKLTTTSGKIPHIEALTWKWKNQKFF